MKLTPEKCLVIVLRPAPTFVWSDNAPVGGIEIDGSFFRNAGHGEWTGFYDWLRSSTGKVTGVRYWPFDDTKFLCDVVRGFAHIIPVGKSAIEFFFTTLCEFDEELSDDRDSMYSIVLVAGTGVYALAFSAHWLSNEDIQQISATLTL